MIFAPHFLTDETVDFIDSYIIRVIINAKNSYYRKQTRHKKHGIVVVSLEQYDKDLLLEDPDFHHLEK